MLSENRTPTWDGYHSLSGERAVPSVRAEGQVSVLPPVSYMKLWKCADSTEQQVTVDLLTEAVFGTRPHLVPPSVASADA